MTDVRLSRFDELDDAERAASRALRDAVYSPAEIAEWPGRDLDWAGPEWCVRVFGDAGTLVSYGGVLVRDARLNDRAVRIGGVGGVRTHPAARRRGHAAAVMARAVEFFRERGDVDFALIVCEPRLLRTYARMGWTEFRGELLTLQHGETVPFTFNRVMTHAVREPAPESGVIDLGGPPW